MPTRKRTRCVACGAPLERVPRGHGKRFCGAACRVAAYRRRRQRLAESTPRWERARGRLRLSGLAAFEKRQAWEAVWRADLDERRRQDAARRPVRPDRPPTDAELAAMTDEQILALAGRPRPPLPDDWMLRR